MDQDQIDTHIRQTRSREQQDPSLQQQRTFSDQRRTRTSPQPGRDASALRNPPENEAKPKPRSLGPDAAEAVGEMTLSGGTSHQPARFSRRKLLIAGGATAGLVAATSLGVLELRQLLQKHGSDILGSLRIVGNRHQLPPAIQEPYATPQDVVIFSGKLSKQWNDWSWPHPYPVTQTPAFTDGSAVIRFSPANGNAVYFSHSPINTTGFGYLQFWVHGGTAGGQQIVAGMTNQYYIFTNEPSINGYTQGGFIQFGQWRLVRIPLADLQSADATIGGVVIRDASGSLQPDLYLADIRLVHLINPNRPVLLSGDAPDLATILLFFDRQMLADDVQATHFYQISSVEDNGYYHPTQPSATRYDPVQKSVGLVVPASLRDGKRYLVSVGNLRSADGPMLAEASSVTVTAHALELQVDISKKGREISPYIYGVNWAPDEGYMTDLRPRVNRWGGEQTSRYNWKLGNAFNAGSDYYFQNGHYQYGSAADRQPSGVADQFVARNSRHGIESLLTVPAIGWVAKDDLASSASKQVPLYGGPPISPESDICYNGYNPAGNRQRTSVPSRARKGSPFSDPPNRSDPTVAQDEWIYHLVNRFGAASDHGVRFYGIDNEPELWAVLQRDIRPAQIDYEQSLNIFLDYATAVKDVDSSAMITGPVVWGWPNYFYSALDRNVDNFKSLPDFHAHNDTPFLIWWMQQIKKHDDAAGRRNLDMLDMHFSPAGLNPYDANPARNDPAFWPTRLRSTRLLWDRTYKDEFWVNNYVYLIPRMLEWIDQSYPGTKLAISEYSWGGLNVMNGALAQAEVLGIFGREGVYLACTWPPPDPYSPIYYAFKLYSNFDGQGGWVNGTSIQASSTQPETISCFAAEQKNGDVFVMILNKNIRESLTPTIHLPGLAPRNVTVYRYGPDPRQPLAQVDSFTLKDQTLRPALPPYSISLFYLAKPQ